jgi:outer membrane protease
MRSISATRLLICLPVLLLVLAVSPTIAPAEGENPPAPGKPAALEKPWSVELHVKRYFSSHTSYEFGNPFEPYQAPLSRLEFPINTWWAGAEFRRSFLSRVSAGVEIMTNLSRESDGLMRDSDWEDEERPTVLTTYSESSCRMEPSYMVRGDVDLKVGDWLGLPVWFDLRPVVGVRWQRFELVPHDGVQISPAPGDSTPPVPLPGEGIRFEQTYWQYFLGIRATYDLRRQLPASPLKISGQLDWAYVKGDNSDHHLLKAGNRWTYEETNGYAWHALLGIKAGLTESISAGLEAEYLRLRTTGSHRLVNDLFNVDFKFYNGVTVWSEQISLMLKLEYVF